MFEVSTYSEGFDVSTLPVSSISRVFSVSSEVIYPLGPENDTFYVWGKGQVVLPADKTVKISGEVTKVGWEVVFLGPRRIRVKVGVSISGSVSIP